ncbi:hypothetical protein ACGC1H_006799 [Rhizoctonia solani]
MSTKGKSPCLAVQRWEDAHTSLLSALTSYMDTCTNLKSSPLAELGANTEDLVPRIERHITSLGSFISCQVFQTRSVLSTTRNQLVSRIYALPEEVLVEIFTQVIYHPIGDKHRYKYPSMRPDLQSIYGRLYNLVGVCSSWRSLAVRKKGFWSIVPIVEKCECSGHLLEDVTERSLRRSGGTGLYIAIDSSYGLPWLLRPLISYGKHIQVLNIQTKSRRTLREVMSTLAVFSSPGMLSELSIYLKPITENEPPTDLDWEIIEHPSQHQEQFKRILGSLRVLRIRVAHIGLYDISFTNLVDLQLEDIQFGYKPMFKRLLGAISSALNLQYLRLASVSSIALQDPDSTPQGTINDDVLSILLPNLKQVYLSSMWFNDLETVFESFVPGNEKWILSLADYCMGVNVPRVFPKVTIQKLGLLFQGFNIDTLMLSGQSGENWLDGTELFQLLKVVPTVTTLEMFLWDLDRQRWEALTRPQDPGGHEVGSTWFPCIRNFHIYNSRIIDEYGIQAVVTSHNVQRLRMGGFLASASDDYNPNTITDKDAISVWLASNVSDFQLMGSYDAPESMVNRWRLW